MLPNSSRLKIEDILLRLSRGEQVSLKERIYINEIADKDQTVYSWLKKAKRLQYKKGAYDQIDSLISDLNLGSPDPEDISNPSPEDIGEWFSGAPSWLARS
tara:strand:+ start:45793 stop:46095 length:303 start_codon:yes stop_codon:yes gene_type:complete